MRSRIPFAADEILRRATKIEVAIYRENAECIGITYAVSGDLLNPLQPDEDGCLLDDERHVAKQLLAALLQEGSK